MIVQLDGSHGTSWHLRKVLDDINDTYYPLVKVCSQCTFLLFSNCLISTLVMMLEVSCSMSISPDDVVLTFYLYVHQGYPLASFFEMTHLRASCGLKNLMEIGLDFYLYSITCSF